MQTLSKLMRTGKMNTFIKLLSTILCIILVCLTSFIQLWIHECRVKLVTGLFVVLVHRKVFSQKLLVFVLPLSIALAFYLIGKKTFKVFSKHRRNEKILYLT